jgi:hypothetical protein
LNFLKVFRFFFKLLTRIYLRANFTLWVENAFGRKSFHPNRMVSLRGLLRVEQERREVLGYDGEMLVVEF